MVVSEGLLAEKTYSIMHHPTSQNTLCITYNIHNSKLHSLKLCQETQPSHILNMETPFGLSINIPMITRVISTPPVLSSSAV